MLSSPQQLFIIYPTSVYLSISVIFALFALHVSPSFVPLVLLLATLRLYVVSVIKTVNARFRIFLSIICLAAATTVANIGFSLNAISGFPKPSAVLLLFVFTCFSSSLIVASILLENVIHPGSTNQWSKFVLFPMVWSTVMLFASAFSPLGYIATWTPVLGASAYTWTRPYLGPSGIDWAVGGWASVISELVGTWIMSSEEQPILISTNEDEISTPPGRTKKSSYLLIITGFLTIATLPSYFVSSFPTPTNSEDTIPLPLACIHPYLEDTDRLPSFDEYLEETMRHTSLAKVVLWPEGAVRFESESSKQEAINKVAHNAAGSVIGVSFYERMNDTTAQSDKYRNGIMLIDRNGVQLEYFKRHLVPYVESSAMVAYKAAPGLFDYKLITKRNSRGKAIEHRTVSITASICLDFAHPKTFGSLERRPDLILAPGKTWHPNIGEAMWEQARARAEEAGSAVMWCDGGSEGINGVGGHGMGTGSIVRVGPGSWDHTIGLEVESEEGRTAYAYIGPWLSVIFVWLVFGTEKVFELCIRKARGKPVPDLPPWLLNVPLNVRETYLAYKRGREQAAANQRPDEYTSLLE